jgi:hypothetical protein
MRISVGYTVVSVYVLPRICHVPPSEACSDDLGTTKRKTQPGVPFYLLVGRILGPGSDVLPSVWLMKVAQSDLRSVSCALRLLLAGRPVPAE